MNYRTCSSHVMANSCHRLMLLRLFLSSRNSSSLWLKTSRTWPNPRKGKAHHAQAWANKFKSDLLQWSIDSGNCSYLVTPHTRNFVTMLLAPFTIERQDAWRIFPTTTAQSSVLSTSSERMSWMNPSGQCTSMKRIYRLLIRDLWESQCVIFSTSARLLKPWITRAVVIQLEKCVHDRLENGDANLRKNKEHGTQFSLAIYRAKR